VSESPQERNANVVLTADVDAYNQSMKQASQSTTGLSAQVDALAKSLDSLAKSAGQKLQIFGAGTAAGIVGVTAAYASFEKQMSSLQAQAAVTNRSFSQMETSVNQLRREFPVTTGAAADLVRTLGGLKDGTARVSDLAETFTRLGAATGESTGALTQGLLGLQRQMGTTQKDTAKYANVLTDLSQKNGVAASSILDFSSAIAPIGRIAGMTQTEIMGVSTAFTKAGQDGYAAGNAFNKMLTDIMQATQSGSPDLAKYANLIGVTVDQFAKMDKTSAITDVFNELNRLGPNAIQILNRMGLDGMRTMRAIAGVTQQTGGIGKQIVEARAAYGDTGAGNALGRGSEAAVGGLSDALVRLQNSSKQIGEGLGKNFAPVATQFVDGVNAMAGAAAKLVDGPLGTMASMLASVASAAGLVGGTLLKFAGPLATLATGYALTRNAFTGGIMDQLRGRTDSKYQQAQAAGTMGPVRSGMYAAGEFLGNAGNNLRQRIGLGQPGQGPGIMSRIAGLPLHAAAAGLNFLQTGYDPLHHPFDPTRRQELIGAGSVSGAFNQFIQGRGGALAGGANQMGAARQGMSAAWQQIMGTGSTAQAGQNVSRAFGGLGSGATALTRSFVSFNAGLARATAGLAVLATRATGSVAMSGLRAAGRGIMNFAGGPIGLGLMAGTGILAGRSQIKDATSLQGLVGQGADQSSMMDTYRSAVGAATTATYDFAKAMKDATAATTPTTVAGAKTVSQSDVGTAMTRDYTNPAMGKMDEGGIKNLLRSAMTGKETPAAIQEIKLDLLKRFGGDTQKVQGILDDITSGQGNFDFSTYLTEAAKSNPGGLIGGTFKTSDTSKTYYSQLGAEVQNRAARAGTAGGPQAFQQQTLADFNALLKGAGQSYGSLTSAGIGQQNQFFGQMYLGGKGTVENLARNAQGGSVDDMTKVWKDFLSKDGDAGKAFDEFLGRAGLNREDVQRILNGETVNGMDRTKLFNTQTNSNLAQLDASVLTGPEQTAQRIAATRAGGATQNLAEVQAAISSPGDVNKQLQAVDAMVTKLQGMGESAAGIQGDLINLKAAIGDTTDPLYQLAAAAQSAAKDFASFQLSVSGAGVGQQYALAGQSFQATMGASTGPEGEQERKQALADIRSQTLSAAQFFKQQIINQREFTISRQNAEDDFATQRSRNDRNFNLQQNRQQFDYNLQQQRGEADYTQSRMRNQEDYNVSRQRSEEQYQISVKRTLDDYNTSRQRGEADYQLSIKRNAQAFNISQTQSYEDFKTSKIRSEQDFNHQVTLMVEQSAKQMMNIYERVTVQRTWSAASLLQNAQDQNRRMAEQAQNLDKARSMGFSSDTIKQLGLTDADNAQQLARLVADAASDPNLVGQFNKAVADRLKDSSSLVKDQDNAAWEEMNRQYQLSLQRGEQDFNKSRDRAMKAYKLQLSQQADDYRTALTRGQQDLTKMLTRGRQDYTKAMKQGSDDYDKAMTRAAEDYKKTTDRSAADYQRTIARQVHDYNVSINDMVTDFEKQMNRSQQQFDRMTADLSMSLEEILTTATKKLTGNLKTEADLMLATWNKIKKDVLTVSGQLKAAIDTQWGFLPDGRKGSRSSGSGAGGGHEATGTGGGSGAPTAPVKDNQPTIPITGGHITTPFGKKGSMWASGYHTGDDYATPIGTPIHAALPGKVMSTAWGGAYGNLTKIAVGPGIETWYAHQSSFGVKPGERVKEGEVIGKTGATGNVTGPHLHFEVRDHGKPVNPSTLGQMMSSGATSGVTLEEQYAFEQLIKNDPTLAIFFHDHMLSDYLNSWADGRQAQLGVSSPVQPGGPGHAPTNVTGNKAIVKQMSAARGWGQYWDSLYNLLMGESGFNNNAQNPTSSAYGMFQFLNSTWAGVGGHKTSDPTLQTKYGLEYIARSYGNPGNAYAKWKARSPHWYGEGAIFSGAQQIGIGERGPEAVLPLNERGADFIAELMAKMSPGQDARRNNTRGTSVPIVHNNTYTKVDSSTNFTGPVSVTANDPNELAEKLRQKRRAKALSNPALGGNRA
jgi:TP901 family phage tail tape measure protein